MTPELKNACEVVFQYHKASIDPVNWNKELFRGQISIGLREMAKETLYRKNVIFFPNPAKRINTLLNPAAMTASDFEEAIQVVQNKVPFIMANKIEEQPRYISAPVSEMVKRSPGRTPLLVRISGEPETEVVSEKWYLKPIFYYFVWPACALALSVMIAYFITSVNF